MYVDGVEVLDGITQHDTQASEWGKTSTLKIPAHFRTIAILCEDEGGSGYGVLGSLHSTSGVVAVTGDTWRCGRVQAEEDVADKIPQLSRSQTFPQLICTNGCSPWGTRSDISDEAVWIWDTEPGPQKSVSLCVLGSTKPSERYLTRR